jgi:hypothetical protein
MPAALEMRAASIQAMLIIKKSIEAIRWIFFRLSRLKNMAASGVLSASQILPR